MQSRACRSSALRLGQARCGPTQCVIATEACALGAWPAYVSLAFLSCNQEEEEEQGKRREGGGGGGGGRFIQSKCSERAEARARPEEEEQQEVEVN